MRLEAQLLLDALDGVAYLTDDEGVVRAVGRTGWDSSASDAGSRGPPASHVTGRSIFDLMQAPIGEVYRRLHRRILEGERSHVAFEYRCDAPAIRREMRMSISLVGPRGRDALLLHQSQMLSCMARPWVKLFEPDRILEHVKADAGLPIVRLCGFCQRVAWTAEDKEVWIEAEDYYLRGGAAEVRTSHGVCPSCHTRL